MAIIPIQTNIENTKSHKPYREAKGTIKTNNNVKPLPPEGHLVHDSVVTVPKYFIKDRAYDIKAIKDGLAGNANDHQQGRLNDVGLVIGGLGIATMLAARTKNPMVRFMEFAGLGSFLASMSLFPLVAIKAPSRIIQGFDIGKEYIDDQGRKKSVFQDPNYIPFDMYKGDYPGEDLDVIGDRMGIPRGIKNRHDLIKEQARKVGIQTNTLWMLMAGFGTPVLAALMCCGLEKLVGPAMEKVRNQHYNSEITQVLHKTEAMSDQIDSIKSNKLSKEVEKILVNYKGKQLPKVEYDNLVEILTKGLDTNAAEGIKADLSKIFLPDSKGAYSLSDNFADNLVNSIRANIPSSNRTILEKVFIPSKEEVSEIVKKYDFNGITDEELSLIKGEFKKLFDNKINSETGMPKEALSAYRNEVLENLSKNIKSNHGRYVNENNIKDVVDFAKVLGDFKANQELLDKCKSFKVEHAPETVIARSYNKFEKTLLEVLGIKYKDLKQMRESEAFTKEILEKHLSDLTKDENKYQEAVTKLAKVMSEMEVNLNGKSNTESHLKDLITGIENNYNNTAKRLNKIGKFNNTIDKLVKEDVSTLSNTINSRQDLFDLLDGVKVDKYADKSYWSLSKADKLEYAKYNSRGVGSSKNLEISRIIERYQGAKNSFNRILHLLEEYKRPLPEGDYNKEVANFGRNALLTATSSDHTMKLNTINNSEFYKDVMNRTWNSNLTTSTEKGLSISKDIASGDVLGRFKRYITRFKDIMGNNNIDFTKPNHNFDSSVLKKYTKSEQTRMSKFNLVAQNSVEMIKNAAERKYGNQKWLKIASAIGGSVIGATIISQFGFGKIRNPQNIFRKVSDDANK